MPFHALQIADFVDAVRAGREPAVTGREAAKSLAILTALYASAKSGRPERVPTLETTSMNTPIGIAHLTLLRARRRPSS